MVKLQHKRFEDCIALYSVKLLLPNFLVI